MTDPALLWCSYCATRFTLLDIHRRIGGAALEAAQAMGDCGVDEERRNVLRGYAHFARYVMEQLERQVAALDAKQDFEETAAAHSSHEEGHA